MMACPDELALTRAISLGADSLLDDHVASCATCRATWDATTRAIEIARQREVPMPKADRREEIRTAILAAQVAGERPGSIVPRSRRVAWITGAAFAAAAVISIVLLTRTNAPAPGHAHATILPRAGAFYTTTSMTPDEIVTLHDGSIEVQVAPLHPGERFRVILADAQIEVHGTAFVATARAGRLVSVMVSHGVVEVRSTAAPAQRLVAGESWQAPTEVVSAEPAPMTPQLPPRSETAPPPIATERMTRPRRPNVAPQEPPSAAATSPETTAPPAAAKREPHEIAYDDAWNAMRAGQFTHAATAFARVQILDPAGPLAEDAGLWYAVALERSGQSSQAATAFRDFIAAFPASRRVGEASAMLGWILVDANERDEAARRFRAAIGDPTPAVRDSAKAGLDAVSKMK